MPSYYKNWDKIDVDEEIKKIESGENIGFDSTVTNQNMSQEDFLKATSGATPHTKLVIKGGSQLSDSDHIIILKDKGNTHFKL